MEMPTELCRINFLPSSPVQRERGRREVRALGAGQALGTPHMAPAFHGLRIAPGRQWTGPGLEACSPRIEWEPECQRITLEENCQLPGRCPNWTRARGLSAHLPPASPCSHWLLGRGHHLQQSSFGKDGGRMGRGPKLAWGARKKERVHQNGADKLTICLDCNTHSLLCFHNRGLEVAACSRSRCQSDSDTQLLSGSQGARKTQKGDGWAKGESLQDPTKRREWKVVIKSQCSLKQLAQAPPSK